MQPQPATQPVAMPGFTAEQTASLQAMITAAVNEALDKYFGPQQATQATQQFIPPAPQAKKEEVKETRSQPLYQATVEDDAESTAESTRHGNSMLTGSKSPDSKTACQQPTFLATSLASSFGALFGRLATFFFGTFLASQFGYIRCMEEMEASGEG